MHGRRCFVHFAFGNPAFAFTVSAPMRGSQSSNAGLRGLIFAAAAARFYHGHLVGIGLPTGYT
jgi:hypothetical protein